MIIYLYIKQHSITGLKYFGKTISNNPFKYPGSGVHWNRHINKHGKEYIKTLEIFGFDNQESATNFALKFSADNNIVESLEWANKVPENALHGQAKGFKHTQESKLKMAESSKNVNFSEEHRRKISIANSVPRGPHSKIRSENISKAKKGVPPTASQLLGLNITAKKNKGKTRTNESKLKISQALTGKIRSKEHSMNISKSKKGCIPWNKGLKLSS